MDNVSDRFSVGWDESINLYQWACNYEAFRCQWLGWKFSRGQPWPFKWQKLAICNYIFHWLLILWTLSWSIHLGLLVLLMLWVGLDSDCDYSTCIAYFDCRVVLGFGVISLASIHVHIGTCIACDIGPVPSSQIPVAFEVGKFYGSQSCELHRFARLIVATVQVRSSRCIRSCSRRKSNSIKQQS
jgi:hypothetical protein